MILRKNKPARLEQPTAVEGARATGTRFKECVTVAKNTPQGPRATNRCREGFGRVRADWGVAKERNCYQKTMIKKKTSPPG